MVLEEKRNYWYEVCQNYIRSGLKRKQYCLDNDISLRKFQYWIAKFFKEASIQPSVDFAEVTVVEDNATKSVNSGVSLSINNINVMIDNNFDVDTLSKVIKVINTYVS